MQFAGNVPLAPLQQWQFAIEIQGFSASFWTECEIQGFSNEVNLFDPAGSLFSEKTAGRMVFKDVVLRKGKSQISTDNSVMAWQAQIANVITGTGTMPSDYQETIDIVEYDRTGAEIRRQRLYGAFPKDVVPGHYRGSSSETVMEELTIAYQYMALVPVTA